MIELPRGKDSILERHTGVARERLKGDIRIAETYLGRARLYLGWLRHNLAMGDVGHGVRHLTLPGGVKIRVLFDGAMNIIEIFAPPGAPEDEGRIIYGYLETGLLVFTGFVCPVDEAAFLLKNTELTTWESQRQAIDRFTLIGKMAYNQQVPPGNYPPLPAFPGSTDHEGDKSEAWLCPRAFAEVVDNVATQSLVASSHQASIFSGRLMRLFVQAKYGAGASVAPVWTNPALGLYVGPVDAVVIDGVHLSNRPELSHWLIEYRSNDVIEWWCMEARNDKLSARRLELDELGRRLARDIIRLGITDETDLDWMRVWILRGATFQTNPDLIADHIIDSNLPIGNPLAYGWHVSASGKKAATHDRETVLTLQPGEVLENQGLNWTRHDMDIGLTYNGTEPVWTVSHTETAVGYLEIHLASSYPLHVWEIDGDTWEAWPIYTDARLTRPPRIVSDAEVFGWFDGENWKPVKIDEKDEDVSYTSSYQWPWKNGCEIVAENPRIYYGGTPSTTSPRTVVRRTVTIDINHAHIDRTPSLGTDVHIYSESFTEFSWRDWLHVGNITTCPPDAVSTLPLMPDCEHLNAILWRRTYSGIWTLSNEILSNRSRGGLIAFTAVIGNCDGGVFVDYDSKAADISMTRYLYRNVPIEMEAEWHCQLLVPGSFENGIVSSARWNSGLDYLWYINSDPVIPSETIETDNGRNEKEELTVTYAFSNSIREIYHDTGGTAKDVENANAINGYSVEPLVFGGWLGYLSVGPLDLLFLPSPIYVSNSARTEVWRSATTPGGGDVIWSDESFGQNQSTTSVFAGSI